MRLRALCAVALTLLIAVPLSGCFGPMYSGRDYGISQFEVVGGTGATTLVMDHGGRNESLERVALSPGGTRITLAFQRGHVELWSGEGVFLKNLSVDPGATPCGEEVSVEFFLDEETFAGFVGQCPVLARTDGTVLEWAAQPQAHWAGEQAIALEGSLVLGFNESGDLHVAETFGSRSVPVVVGDGTFSFTAFSVSPDGTKVAAGMGTTRFFRVDFGNGTSSELSQFQTSGDVFFSADSAWAVQVPGRYEWGRGQVKLFDLSAPMSQAMNLSCERVPPGGEVPVCPHPGDRPVVVSPNARIVAWPWGIEASWQEEDLAGHMSTNITEGPVVRILDTSDPNITRGFLAGPLSTNSQPADPLHAQPLAQVRAIRVFDDGSAMAVACGSGRDSTVYLTHASAGATQPEVVGRYI